MTKALYWECHNCGLPDPYNGGGDGIGSCDCPRCDYCGGVTWDCECDNEYDFGEDTRQ